MRKLLLFALAALLPTAALPQTRPLPDGTVKDGAVSFGTVLPNIAKREGNKTIITPDTLQILGTGSTGDISGMSVGGTTLSTAMGQKAPLASPTFTGTATAPSIALTGSGSTGDGSGFTVKTTTVPGGRALSNFLNAPDFATPDTYDASTKGATTAYVQNFWKQRQGNTVSPFDYCTGPCGKGSTNDTAAVQAAMDAMKALQAFGVQSPSLDLRGGMFAVNAPLTMTGTPYSMTFGNGSIIPFNGYTGDFFDFSGTTTTTKLKFLGLVLNGYNTARHLIRLGPKTQGTIVMFCGFYGWTGTAFLDPTTVAATENQIINNVFQGGSGNQGVGIDIAGNDSEIFDNVIYNVTTGVRTRRASHTVSRNHIYSADPAQPIALVQADTGDQMQLVANYFDSGYVFVKDPSGLQFLANRILMPGSVPANQYSPLVLQPSTANATFLNVLIQGNVFRSLFPPPIGNSPIYSPIRIDTSLGGSIANIYNVHMKDNGFFGFKEHTSEPSGSFSGTGTSTFAVNLADKIPFGVLAAVDSVVCSFGYSAINNVGIGSGDPFNKIVYVNTATNQNGSCRVKATINQN